MNLLEDEDITIINDGLQLIQKKAGLTFGTDALLLSAFVKKIKGAVCADFGSGTGVVSLLTAYRGEFSKIYACEIQEEYCDIIKRNIKLNNLDNIIEPVHCDIRNFKKECDIIFSNPPYMKHKSGFISKDNGRDIARREVFGDINDFCLSAANNLKFGGFFYVVFRVDRLPDLFYAMRCANIEPKRMFYVKNTNDCVPKIVLVEGKKGANSGMVLLRDFVFYKNGVETEESKLLYEKGIISL